MSRSKVESTAWWLKCVHIITLIKFIGFNFVIFERNTHIYSAE